MLSVLFSRLERELVLTLFSSNVTSTIRSLTVTVNSVLSHGSQFPPRCNKIAWLKDGPGFVSEVWWSTAGSAV